MGQLENDQNFSRRFHMETPILGFLFFFFFGSVGEIVVIELLRHQTHQDLGSLRWRK
jgi:hypothetical protein